MNPLEKECLSRLGDSPINPVRTQAGFGMEIPVAEPVLSGQPWPMEMIVGLAERGMMLEDAGEFLRAATELVRKSFGCQSVNLWTFGPQEEDFLLRAYAHESLVNPVVDLVNAASPYSESELQQQWRSGGPHELLSTDLCQTSFASQLTMPLRVRGKFLGLLSLVSADPNAFSPEHRITAERAAQVIASALSKFRILAQSHRSHEYLEMLLRAAKDLAILSIDIHGYVYNCSTGAHSIFGSSGFDILGKDILSLFTDPFFQKELAGFIGKPQVTALERKGLRQCGVAGVSYLDVTFQRMLNPAKTPVGSLCIVRDVTEAVLSRRNLERLSITDELTGLRNRRHFAVSLANEAARSRRIKRGYSVCFIDIDGFARFNSCHGRLQGDEVLKQVAAILCRTFRSQVDKCCRFGGDEFVILLPETLKSSARTACERVRACLDAQFQGGITTSIGITDSSDSPDENELIPKANEAMSSAKSMGGNCIVLWENDAAPLPGALPSLPPSIAQAGEWRQLQ